MPVTVTVPGTLNGHAREIWRGAFLSSYDGTCKERSDKDACAAAIAWSSVKEDYRKDADGEWVRKAIFRADDAVVGIPVAAPDTGQYPQQIAGQERTQSWRDAFNAALLGECASAPEPVTCAMEVANRSERNDRFTGEENMEERRLISPVLMERATKAGMVAPKDDPTPEKPLSPIERMRFDEASEDKRLIESGMASHIAQRPRHINSNDWMARPLQERTIGHLVIERAIERTYEESVERTIAEGWQAISNPSRKGEVVFQRWIDALDGMLLQRAVLVRKGGTTDWRLRELSRGASMSLAVQIPPDERRFGDNRAL